MTTPDELLTMRPEKVSPAKLEQVRQTHTPGDVLPVFAALWEDRRYTRKTALYALACTIDYDNPDLERVTKYVQWMLPLKRAEPLPAMEWLVSNWTLLSTITVDFPWYRGSPYTRMLILECLKRRWRLTEGFLQSFSWVTSTAINLSKELEHVSVPPLTVLMGFADVRAEMMEDGNRALIDTVLSSATALCEVDPYDPATRDMLCAVSRIRASRAAGSMSWCLHLNSFPEMMEAYTRFGTVFFSHGFQTELQRVDAPAREAALSVMATLVNAGLSDDTAYRLVIHCRDTGVVIDPAASVDALTSTAGLPGELIATLAFGEAADILTDSELAEIERLAHRHVGAKRQPAAPAN